MRETETKIATKQKNNPIIFVLAKYDKQKANAKADVACPDGKLRVVCIVTSATWCNKLKSGKNNFGRGALKILLSVCVIIADDKKESPNQIAFL